MLIVKVGGSFNINWDAIIEDIAKLNKSGEQVVLVHGASQFRDKLAKKLNKPSKIITSPSGIQSVYTDRQAIDVFLMAYAGKINKRIVEKFQQKQLNAIGLTGADGRIWLAKRKDKVLYKEEDKVKVLHDNLTGRVTEVNGHLLYTLLDNKYIPILTPPALSYEGQLVNVDNDIAIAAMVEKLNIKKLVILFESGGLLKDIYDKNSIIKKIQYKDIEDYYKYAKGRMMKKIIGAKEALENGAEKVYWGDSNSDAPITDALNGSGTIIYK